MRRIFTIFALLCMTISAFSNGNPSANFDGNTKGIAQQNDYLQGDANDDGVVDVADVTVIVSAIFDENAQINFDNADANADGVIDLLDIMIVVGIIYSPGYEYVDLGLPSGLKWATCNVGAENPEDYGDYFAWGEIETKNEFTDSNSVTFGVQMDDISGNPEYDAATANWGEEWRMPNREEFQELVSECTWEWTTENGVDGNKVTGPNGNYIFLPAAGYRVMSTLYDAGAYGFYWSTTPLSNNNDAYNLYCGEYNYNVDYYCYRYVGQSIRPVKVEAEPEYEHVDFGLSSGVKWATCNVGAENPEDYGDYFAWGETVPKAEYTQANCKTHGVVMEDISGNPEYDAAVANWGTDWRMPTNDECIELLNECNWQFTTQNGVVGYKVVGPNGNHIFLPATGYYNGALAYNVGEVGHVWTSTPLAGMEDIGTNYLFHSDSFIATVGDVRFFGRTVRPVKQ